MIALFYGSAWGAATDGESARISHGLSTASADLDMSAALRSVGLLVSMPVCAASIRNPVRNAGGYRCQPPSDNVDLNFPIQVGS